MVRNCGFSETFFFVVCNDIWIAIYPSFVVVLYGDKPETIYESFYKIEDTSIIAWSLIPIFGHYCWLHGLIVNYLLTTSQII